jgi:hypothetical protein
MWSKTTLGSVPQETEAVITKGMADFEVIKPHLSSNLS